MQDRVCGVVGYWTRAARHCLLQSHAEGGSMYVMRAFVCVYMCVCGGSMYVMRACVSVCCVWRKCVGDEGSRTEEVCK